MIARYSAFRTGEIEPVQVRQYLSGRNLHQRSTLLASELGTFTLYRKL